ncbi:hypothetical protein FHS26_006921 [Rhizobium pisi]|uniref:Endonuclease/exonuclease/phosphatase family protein n=1 Tax=Rhizobium pisi TaxID=574561 RepID=A0A3R8ZTA2_9HYPH|nr:hypothetical protein [Rhizobium pisi]RSB58722.1 hypothetical protein EFD55_32980 [Rhizobium pisi]
MLAIAYWNLGKRAQVQHVVDLTFELTESPSLSGPHGEAIIGLSETGRISVQSLRAALGTAFSVYASDYKSFICISKLASGQLTSEFEEEHAWPFLLHRGAGQTLETHCLWFVHRPSPFGKFNPRTYSTLDAAKLRQRVEVREAEQAIAKSILIGDFNSDPYCDSMVAAGALNSAMCRNIASHMRFRTEGKGRYQKKIPMFYNAMWANLGDQTSTAQPGSFFNDGDISDSTIWHALDQVLIRPSLIPTLPTGTPKYLTNIRATNLLKPQSNGIDTTISDHLPVVVTMKI